jgi:predicted nucleic acid-binding protein
VKVLVDTSVWSLALRKGGPADHPAVRKLRTLLEGNEAVVLTPLILQECLQAFRGEKTFQKMVGYFEPFPLLPLGREEAVVAARLHRNCARKGVSASTVDCAIAAAAVHHECSLLTADDDFKHVARHSKLRLA